MDGVPKFRVEGIRVLDKKRISLKRQGSISFYSGEVVGGL